MQTQDAKQVDEPQFVMTHLERISDAYRDNPAAADVRFQGKTGRFPFFGSFERRGSKTIARWVRAVMVPNPHQPDVVLDFDSEEVVAKLNPGQIYTFDGHCEGLINGEIVFRAVVLISEGNLALNEK